MRKYKLLRLYTELRERACFHNPSKAKRLIILEVSKQIGEKNTSWTRCGRRWIRVGESERLEKHTSTKQHKASSSGTIHGDQMPHTHDLESFSQPARLAFLFTHTSHHTQLSRDQTETRRTAHGRVLRIRCGRARALESGEKRGSLGCKVLYDKRQILGCKVRT